MTEEADQLQTAEYAARIAQNAEKKLRQLGLTQTDLCDRLKGGVWSPSRATLSRFLGGGYESVTMTSVKVSELAEALKTEVFVLEGSAHTALESYVQLLGTRWAEKLVLPISGRSNFGLPDVFISPKIELTKEPTDPFFTSLESGQLSASDLEFTDMSYRMIEDLVTAIERERNNRRRVDAGIEDGSTIDFLVSQIGSLEVMPGEFLSGDIGMGLSKGEPQLLEWANGFIADYISSGDFEKYYHKWWGDEATPPDLTS